MTNYFYDKLSDKIISPDQTSYSLSDNHSIYASNTKGGKLRTRLDSLNAYMKLSLQWSLNREEYIDFRNFYTNILNNGAKSFKIDLYVDKAILTEHEAVIIKDSVKLSEQSGDLYKMQFDIQCNAIDFTDAEYWDFIKSQYPNPTYNGIYLYNDIINYSGVAER